MIDQSTPLTTQGTRLAVAGFYSLLVLALWVPFGLRSGMGYETHLIYASETRAFLDGFIYDEVPLRPFTAFFYQVGYQLSGLLGIEGSFVGVQLVYALLWWGRGFLTFLLLRRLVPSSPLLAYAAGALVLVHASDHALNWVGQLNQFGTVFWMLLALYLLVAALQQSSTVRSGVLAVGSGLAAYLSLWSYESPLFILLGAPLLIVPLVGLSRRTLAVLGAYYVVPLLFVLENLNRYVRGSGSAYQESVARDDFAPLDVAGDLVFNLESSLAFWRWGDAFSPGSGKGATIAGVAAALSFAVGSVAVDKLARRNDAPPKSHNAVVVAAGALLVLASFPAYLVLEDARSLWRTQILSGIGFGILAAAALVLVAAFFRPRVRPIVVALGGAAIAYAGGSAAYDVASYHYDVWTRHRDGVTQVLDVAPRVEDGTVLVLTDVPDEPDPFIDNMWFDLAMRLAYPHTAVAGVYSYRGGEPSPGSNLVLRDGVWRREPTGYPTLVTDVSLSRTVIVGYSRRGDPVLLRRVPAFLRTDKDTGAAYDPQSVIRPGEASSLAQRRYGEGAG